MTNREKEILKKVENIENKLIKLNKKDNILKHRLEISALWMEFSKLCETANREGFKSIQEKYKEVVKLFKNFEDTIRVFKTLPDY